MRVWLFRCPSELELDRLKIPVEENHSVTPPNSLRLKWRSKTGGDWSMILYARPRYTTSGFSGKNIFVWCYARKASPQPRRRGSTSSTPNVWAHHNSADGFAGEPPPRKWVRLRLPFDSFVGQVNSTRKRHFDPSKLDRITLVQGLDDGESHTLYLDDIEIADDPREPARAFDTAV